MSLLNAAMLVGLAALAVPIVLHLIQRQRYPERVFPTNRFFQVTQKHNVIQRRLVDKLLLLLRLAALAALVFAIARPIVSGALGERRRSVVIVVDNSPSMGRKADGKTLLERAKESAAAVLAELGSGDRVELLLVAPESWTIEETGQGKLDEEGSSAVLEYGTERAAKRLDETKLAERSGDLTATLQAAGRLLHASDDGSRQLIVLSDLQARQMPAEPIAELAGIDVTVLPLTAASQGANLAIAGCELSKREVAIGGQVTASLAVENRGATAALPSTVTITTGADQKPVELAIPAVEPRQTVIIDCPLAVMSRERYVSCRATLRATDDALDYDNTYYFQVAVRPQVVALCVNGAGGSQGADRATFFVMRALSPRSADGRISEVDARDADAEGLAEQALFQYGVVMLAGVAQLDEPARQAIEHFVADGRGLLVFPSPEVDPQEYNGWNFLPAEVTAVERGNLASIDWTNPESAGLNLVKQRVGSGLSALSASDYLELQPKSDAVILARLSNGKPALVERRIGKGRVIMAAAGCHSRDSDWPLRPAFPILVRQLVGDLGAPAQNAAIAPERIVGQSAARSIPEEMAAARREVYFASQSTARNGESTGSAARLTAMSEGNTLLLPSTDRPGHYLLALETAAEANEGTQPGLGASVVPIAVNYDPRESDLRPASGEQSAHMISTAAKGEVLAANATPEELTGRLYSGREWWRLLMLGALVCLVVESWYGWKTPSETVKSEV